MASHGVSLAGLRVAVYARYSSDRQSERSARDQIELCRRFIEARGGELGPALTFSDEAISGAVLARPALQALREHIRGRAIDVLVVEDLSRLSRDGRDAFELRGELAYARVRLLGVSDGTDTERAGAALIDGVRIVLAEHERHEIAWRTRRGMEQRARDGLSTGGLPLGYRSEEVAGAVGGRGRDAPRRVVIDEPKAELVRWIFGRYDSGWAPKRIALDLNQQAIPSPRGRGWRASAIRAILLNRRYIGDWSFGRKEWMRHPTTRSRRYRERSAEEVVSLERPDLVIVARDVWDRVAARFAAHPRRSGRPPTRPYLLSGIARCGACAGPLVICGGQHPARYYGCSAAQAGTLCATGRHTVSELRLRSTVLGILRERLLAPHVLEAFHARARTLLEGELVRARLEREDLARTLDRKRDQAARLVAAIAEGLAVSTTVRDTLQTVETEIAALEARRRALAEPRALPSADELVELALDMQRLLDGDVDEAREVLRRCFDGGVVHVDRDPDGGWHVRAGLLPGAILEGDGKPNAAAPVREQRHSIQAVAGARFVDFSSPWVLPVLVRVA